MQCPDVLWVALLLAVGSTTVTTSSPEDDSPEGYDPLLEILEEGHIEMSHKPKGNPFDEVFDRSMMRLGILPDSEWEGVNRRKQYKINDLMKLEQSGGTGFRSAKGCNKGNKDCGPSRGSLKSDNEPVAPLPHQPGTPEGCGNPICVILDSKPRRFHSICSFVKFLKDEYRDKDQINYIQKGDCYDIIDNIDNQNKKNEGGAHNKKWIDKTPENCNRCKNEKSCNKPVIFVVDILNVLKGQSSAPGGPVFSETKRGSQKKLGLPLEFSNVCEALKYFSYTENINVKTQVMGFGVGNANEIFSTKGGDKCLWTEWFDLDTPCNAEEEYESHGRQYARLQSSYAGPYRICPKKSVIYTQHRGGSEWTQIDHKEAEAGNAMGFNKAPFKQNIQATDLTIKCKNKDNTDELPAPFIYAQDRNDTCLDYKTRYCCKVSDMWRPIKVLDIVNQIPATPPLGLSIASYKVPSVLPSYNGQQPTGEQIIGGNTMTVNVLVYDGHKDSEVKQIFIEPISPNNKQLDPLRTFSGYIKNGPTEKEQKIKGNFTEIRLPSGAVEVTYSVYVDSGPTKKSETNPGPIATITVKTDPSPLVKRIVTTRITDHSSGIISETNLDIQAIVDNFDFVKNPFDGKKYKSKKEQALSETVDWKYQAKLTDTIGGVKIIDMSTTGSPVDVINDSILREPKYTGSVMTPPGTGTNIWQTVSDILQTQSITYLVESPPLATLFHECEWKDWVNIDYPGKTNNGSEYELRDDAFNYAKGELAEHVCGSQEDDVHFVDAVTMETQTPWYELTMDSGKRYETFKLTPTFGYACKDDNGAKGDGEFCQDMKLRYCCASKQTAAWGDWAAWSECTKTCGGGKMIRKRDCKQLSISKNKDLKWYSDMCYGQGSAFSKVERKRYSEESTDCNVRECPTDAQFDSWTGWTGCSVTCDKGTKVRSRNCKPAIGGGIECPPKSNNRDLYDQSEDCTQTDCETFTTGQWEIWSACSVTCGRGKLTRSRKCVSELDFKVRSDENCAGKTLEQEKTCKYRDCPVDGAWMAWAAWSGCNQNCIEHPEPGYPRKQQADSDAVMYRDRQCADPRPAFGGKPCPRDKKNDYLSETKAERQRRPCYTENDKDIPQGVIPVPWCPEHCIYSQWGQWSACDKTCITLNIEYSTTKNGPIDQGLMETGHYKYLDISLPTRTRIKCLMRNERFGGVCPEKLDNLDNPGTYNGTVIMDTQSCQLCKEHCEDETNSLKLHDLREFPALEYPGNDKSCVGFCPRDCTMKMKGPDVTCSDEQADYFSKYAKEMRMKKVKKETADDFNVQPEGCFLSTALGRMVYRLSKDAKYKEAEAKVRGFLERVADGKLPYGECRKPTEEIIDFFKSKPMYRVDVEGIERYLEQECILMQDLLWEAYIESPVGPVYDGLVGGKSCMNGNRMITSKPKYDENKYTKHAENKDRKYGSCHLHLCEMNYNPEPGVAWTPQCPFKIWEDWAPWGACNIKCGTEGKRQARRRCVSTCDKDKVFDNADCKPIIDHARNLTWTDMYTENCDPCPPSKDGKWSSWSQWKWEDHPKCYEDTPLKKKRTRVRVCNQGEDNIKCAPNAEGQTEGKEVQFTEHDLPPCEAGGGYNA